MKKSGLDKLKQATSVSARMRDIYIRGIGEAVDAMVECFGEYISIAFLNHDPNSAGQMFRGPYGMFDQVLQEMPQFFYAPQRAARFGSLGEFEEHYNDAIDMLDDVVIQRPPGETVRDFVITQHNRIMSRIEGLHSDRIESYMLMSLNSSVNNRRGEVISSLSISNEVSPFLMWLSVAIHAYMLKPGRYRICAAADCSKVFIPNKHSAGRQRYHSLTCHNRQYMRDYRRRTANSAEAKA